jgi:hypothetical protein
MSAALPFLAMLFAFLHLSVSENPSDGLTLAAVVGFGWLGATVSALTQTIDASTISRIPEITTMFRVPAMRIMVGIASALLVYLALRSGKTELLGFSL